MKPETNLKIKNNRGFTLLEILVAVTIFSLLTVSVFSLYINTTINYTQDERTARMLENGRFALSLIAQDMQMADFWGEMLNPDGIDISAFSLGDDDCGTKLLNMEAAILYYLDGGTLMQVEEDNDDTTLSDFDPVNNSDCNNGGSGTTNDDIIAGTNILAIKRVANEPSDAAERLTGCGTNNPPTDPCDGDIFVNTNGTNASLVEYNGGDTTYNYWKYVPVMYFIRDDTDINGNPVPALCRLELEDNDDRNSGDDIEFEDAPADCLAEGVEHLHVEFGLDTDNDRIANYYVSNVTTAETEDIVSARIYLLTRTDLEDRDYVNQKIYTLGSFAVNGGAPFNDGFYRRVNTTTVVLRNTRALSLFQ